MYSMMKYSDELLLFLMNIRSVVISCRASATEKPIPLQFQKTKEPNYFDDNECAKDISGLLSPYAESIYLYTVY